MKNTKSSNTKFRENSATDNRAVHGQKVMKKLTVAFRDIANAFYNIQKQNSLPKYLFFGRFFFPPLSGINRS